jgi:hypothetical protein
VAFQLHGGRWALPCLKEDVGTGWADRRMKSSPRRKSHVPRGMVWDFKVSGDTVGRQTWITDFDSQPEVWEPQ